MNRQLMQSKLQSGVVKLGKLQQNSKFLLSCISEGLIPKGLRLKLNLAKDVNNEEFCNEINDVIDEANSKILDILYSKQIEIETKSFDDLEILKAQITSQCSDKDADDLFKQVSSSTKTKFLREGEKFGKKLQFLRDERRNIQNCTFNSSQGSRRISARKYVKSSCNKFYVSGAPFPRNLRKSRRNRNHKRQVGAELSQAQSQPDSQEYIVTENDMKKGTQ